jgi:hypothetical protein
VQPGRLGEQNLPLHFLRATETAVTEAGYIRLFPA